MYGIPGTVGLPRRLILGTAEPAGSRLQSPCGRGAHRTGWPTVVVPPSLPVGRGAAHRSLALSPVHRRPGQPMLAAAGPPTAATSARLMRLAHPGESAPKQARRACEGLAATG